MTRNVNTKWRKLDTYNSLFSVLGYHSSYIKKAWIRNKNRKKYSEQQVILIRKYFGTYIVELINMSFFPFNWKIDKSIQFEKYKDALIYSKKLRSKWQKQEN